MKSIRDRLYVATFCDRWEEAVRKYKLGTELDHTCISERLAEEGGRRIELISEMRSDMEISGSDRFIMHGPFTEILPAAIDPLMRDMGMMRLNEAYSVLEELDLRKMVVHNGWMPFIYFKEYQKERGAEFWQRFMEDKPKDMILAVENVLEDEPFLIKDMMDMIGDERIKVCLDVGHAHSATLKEYRVTDWIRILGPRISHIHLHNNNGTDDLHLPLGEGTLDMCEILRAIPDHCPEDVTYTIEAGNALECLAWLEDKGFI